MKGYHEGVPVKAAITWVFRETRADVEMLWSGSYFEVVWQLGG